MKSPYTLEHMSKSMYNESYEDLTSLQQERVQELYELVLC